jgi:hypothetical protein
LPRTSWYNNAEYSDLSVRLRDGREIKVHKIVVCNANDWFKKACGPGSHFTLRPSTFYVLARFRLTETSQESTQDVIKLEEDDPDAIDTILRYIYKIPVAPRHSSSDENPWRYWLDVYTTADKYLVPALSEHACKYFFDFARAERSLNEIADIIETLHTEMNHDNKIFKLAAELRKKHLRRLLQNKRYRETVQDDQALMWEHVDQLLRTDGEVEVNVPPGETKEFYITNNGSFGDRVKVRCESSYGAGGNVRLFQPIFQYP